MENTLSHRGHSVYHIEAAQLRLQPNYISLNFVTYLYAIFGVAEFKYLLPV